MAEAKREKNPEHRRGGRRRRFEIIIDASRRAVRGRFRSGTHRDTVNAPGFRVAGENDRRTMMARRSIGAVSTPDHTTAAADPRHLGSDLVADSMALRWP